MARRKAQRHPVSGAPGVVPKRSAGAPALNPIGLQQANAMPYGNYLDGSAALGKVPHPSSKWAGVELAPLQPREPES